MALNSPTYLAFLPLILAVFLLVQVRARATVLLTASLLFYAALGALELLAALFVVTVASYTAGLLIARGQGARARRWALWLGITADLAVLIALRFQTPIAEAVNAVSVALGFPGGSPFPPTLMSVGVSFYAFQGISYLIDLYLEVAEPERHLGRFALYMSFFPKLLQGPIERASDLLPQLGTLGKPTYEDLRAGVLTFFWGLFKKVVVADRLSMFTGAVFSDVQRFQGVPLLIAVVLYSIEIYADFSGYTDMAIGSARVFGMRLTQNFNRPYSATSVLEFWRRWHISFSRWILDYIFKPVQMGLRSWKTAGTVVALMVTFLASGVWHGAAWTFVLWGGLHGVYMACSVLTRSTRARLLKAIGMADSRLVRWWRIALVFALVSVAWIFFRAENLGDAFYIVASVATQLPASIAPSIADWSHNLLLDQSWREAAVVLVSLMVLAAAGLARSRWNLHSPEVFIQASPPWVRWVTYHALGFALVIFPAPATRAFIYYQF